MTESNALLARTITELDEVRLLNLLKRQFGASPPPLAQALLDVLDYADVVTPQAIEPDIVTMGSQVAFSLSNGMRQTMSIVYPEDADADAARLSILSPIGAALLASRPSPFSPRPLATTRPELAPPDDRATGRRAWLR
jgi:regulator of nucleoside diphosphate kinase